MWSRRSVRARPTSSRSSISTAGRCRGAGAPTPLSPRAVEVAIAAGAVLVDARTNDQFDEAHVPGAISASAYNTGFGTKVAQVVPFGVEVIVVAASDGSELAASELCIGRDPDRRLPTGWDDRLALRGPPGRAARADRSRGARRATRGRRRGPRARRPRPRRIRVGTHSRFPEHPVPGAHGTSAPSCPDEPPIATICSGGKRSGLAASILQREGFDRLIHVANGGTGTWERRGDRSSAVAERGARAPDPPTQASDRSNEVWSSR